MVAQGPASSNSQVCLAIAVRISIHTLVTRRRYAVQQEGDRRTSGKLLGADVQDCAGCSSQSRSNLKVAGHADHRLWSREKIGGKAHASSAQHNHGRNRDNNQLDSRATNRLRGSTSRVMHLVMMMPGFVSWRWHLMGRRRVIMRWRLWMVR